MALRSNILQLSSIIYTQMKLVSKHVRHALSSRTCIARALLLIYAFGREKIFICEMSTDKVQYSCAMKFARTNNFSSSNYEESTSKAFRSIIKHILFINDMYSQYMCVYVSQIVSFIIELVDSLLTTIWKVRDSIRGKIRGNSNQTTASSTFDGRVKRQRRSH